MVKASVLVYFRVLIRPMTRKITEQRKQRFLLALAETGNVRASCIAAAVSRQPIYDLRHADPFFCESVGGGRGDRRRSLGKRGVAAGCGWRSFSRWFRRAGWFVISRASR